MKNQVRSGASLIEPCTQGGAIVRGGALRLSGRRCLIAGPGRYSILVVLCWAWPTFAQTGGGYDLTWSTIDSGGQMVSAGNGYELGGTIGQADAGTLSGGSYALDGGFWPAAAAEAPCTCQLFGDLVDVKGQPLPDCLIDVSDLLCVLDDFSDPAACLGDGDVITSGGACAADGTIDVDDLLAVLDAFAGTFSCPHPCPP